MFPGYAEKEIRLSKTFEWKLYIGKVEMDTSHCELFNDISKKFKNGQGFDATGQHH